MFFKIKFPFLLVVLVCLFAAMVAGQSTRDVAEVNRQIELKKQEIELKKQEIELKKQEIELEKQEQELKILRAKPNKPENEDPGNVNITDTQTSKPPLPVDPIIVQPQDTPETNIVDNTASQECTVQALDEPNATRFKNAICQIINSIIEQRGQFKDPLDPDNTGAEIAEILAAKLSPNAVVTSFFLDSEKKRTDKQVGASPSSSGTTSLVVKGGTPALIGWAVEQGAATSTVSGNTVTIRANPLNLAKALFYKQGIIEIRDVKPREDAFDTFLKKLSLGLSFDITRTTETPVFTGSQQQLSAFSFRYEFINRRNPLSLYNKQLRDDFFDSQTKNLDKIASSLFSIVSRGDGRFKYEELNQWLDETNQELNNIAPSITGSARRTQITAVIESRVGKLPFEQLAEREDIKANLQNFADGSIGFKAGRDKLIDDINDGTVATFEYTNNREPIAPDTSNFRFIWEKGIFRKTDFTFNASLTMYNKKPMFAGVKRIRDFQFALGTETSLGNSFGTGDTTLTFAGRYERLNSDTIDKLGVVMPNSKGDVAIGQIKFTIPIADWGIRLPLSVTFANRTDLIKESTVRANFGFTFDLDPLFARFKPF